MDWRCGLRCDRGGSDRVVVLAARRALWCILQGGYGVSVVGDGILYSFAISALVWGGGGGGGGRRNTKMSGGGRFPGLGGRGWDCARKIPFDLTPFPGSFFRFLLSLLQHFLLEGHRSASRRTRFFDLAINTKSGGGAGFRIVAIGVGFGIFLFARFASHHRRSRLSRTSRR